MPIAAWAQGVVEAGWLTALLVVPLFFSPLSDRMFEPAKVAIVRILAGVMLAAWLAGWLAGPPRRRSLAPRNALALPALALLAASVVGTAGSISPAVSLMGAYDRAQGLYTTASYVVIFFLAAHGMRSLRRVERAVSVALVASSAVALYALVQQLGLDPRPADPAFPGGGGSTLGNPAFLGGYLAMTVPLALWRVVRARSEVARPRHTALYGVLIALQLSAILLSEVRGAVLGLGAGLCLFVILHACLAGRRLLAGAALAATPALVALMLVVQGLGGPDAPVTARSSSAVHADPTADVRKQIWDAAVRLSLPHAALRSAEGSDRLNAARPLVGYGPESLYAASGQMLPRELGPIQGRTTRPDHAHNEPLDALVQTGMLGLAAYLFLLAAVFYIALASLGWIRSGRERRAFVAACVAGGVLVPAFALLIAGRAFAGVTVAAGIGLGVLAFVFLERPAPRSRGRRPATSDGLLVALVAALTAHLVDTQVSIAATSSRTYFWVLAAALVAVSARRGAAVDGGSESQARSAMSHGFRLAVAGLLLGTLVFAFITAPTADAFPDEGSAGLLVVLAGSAAVAIAIGGHRSRSQLRTPAATATIAMLLAFAAAHVYTVERSQAGDLSALVGGAAIAVSCLIFVVLGLGAHLGVGSARPATAPRARLAVALASAVLLTGLSGWLNIRVVQADIVFEQAPTLAGEKRTVRYFRDAVAKQPLQDRAHVLLADAHLRVARAAASRALRERSLAAAERALARARELNPFDPDHALELAALHEAAADLAGLSAEAKAHFERSRRFYAQATRMAPRSVYVHDRHANALIEYSRLEEARRRPIAAARLRRSARRQLERALPLDRDYCLTFALRAHARRSWRAAVADALAAVDRLGPPSPCGGEGLERRVPALASRAIARAGELAAAAGETPAFLERLRHEARTDRASPRSAIAARARRLAQAATRPERPR